MQAVPALPISLPSRQIAIDAGKDGSMVVGKLLDGKSASWGYDAQRDEYVDLV